MSLLSFHLNKPLSRKGSALTLVPVFVVSSEWQPWLSSRHGNRSCSATFWDIEILYFLEYLSQCLTWNYKLSFFVQIRAVASSWRYSFSIHVIHFFRINWKFVFSFGENANWNTCASWNQNCPLWSWYLYKPGNGL